MRCWGAPLCTWRHPPSSPLHACLDPYLLVPPAPSPLRPRTAPTPIAPAAHACLIRTRHCPPISPCCPLLPRPRSEALLQEYFVGRCHANLHVVLLLEAQDAAMQRLILAFPKLFHLATLNVVDAWDGDACVQVGWGGARGGGLPPWPFSSSHTWPR